MEHTVQQLLEAWDNTPATLLKKRERLVVDAFND